jgi:hypothetical protein
LAALLLRYYRDLALALTNIDRAVTKDGSLFFVIGDNKTVAGGTPLAIRSGEVLKEIGESLGWSLRRTIPITVTKEARPHHRNSITANEIIWFRRT